MTKKTIDDAEFAQIMGNLERRLNSGGRKKAIKRCIAYLNSLLSIDQEALSPEDNSDVNNHDQLVEALKAEHSAMINHFNPVEGCDVCKLIQQAEQMK